MLVVRLTLQFGTGRKPMTPVQNFGSLPDDERVRDLIDDESSDGIPSQIPGEYGAVRWCSRRYWIFGCYPRR